MLKYKKWIMACLLFPLILLFVNNGTTNAQSSENFVIKKSVVDQGGERSQSEQFKVTDAIGQPSPVGTGSSANFYLSSGFLSLTQQGIMISVHDTTGATGSTLEIPVYVEDLTGENVFGLSLTLETGTDVLTPLGVNLAGTILNQWGSVTTNITDGQILITSASATALSGSGVLLYVQYQVNSSAQDGDTTQIHFVTAQFNEGSPLAAKSDGLFTVLAGYNVSGAVKYYSNENAVAEANLTLDGNSTATDASGNFTFSMIAPGDYSLTPSKDGDLGNSISAFDASYILREVVGLISLEPFQKIAADVSGNGSISAFDASYVLRYVVNLINEFPVGDDWTFVPTSFAVDENNWNSAPNFLRYEPLNSNQTDQNFKAIVFGDVSGNWSAPGLELAAVPKVTTGFASVKWGKIQRLSAQQIIVPIKVDVSGDLLSAEMELSFDSGLLHLQDVALGKKFDLFYVDYQLHENVLKIALAGAKPVNANAEILELKFDVPDQKSSSATVLEMRDISLNEGQITVANSANQLIFNPNVPQSSELFQNHPNPFNPETKIEYQLHEKAQVKIEVYNLVGQKIRTLENKERQAGHYSVMWDGCDEFGNKVVSGIYLYQIKAGKFVRTRKMALMK
ncbi:MAG: T9SS type A sorting domain-containing protein [Calditrichaeota bacterium]|nr:T9SS type A sorting domain-containing protein [Calditrichota bacterium]